MSSPYGAIVSTPVKEQSQQDWRPRRIWGELNNGWRWLSLYLIGRKCTINADYCPYLECFLCITTEKEMDNPDPSSQSALPGRFPPEVGSRSRSSLGIRFVWEHLAFNMQLKVVFTLRTLPSSPFPVFSSPKWKFNVWRKCQLFLYWSWGTTYFCFREHRCLGWTSLRNVKKDASPAGKPQDGLKMDFVSLLSSASSPGWGRGLFFSQRGVGGKQSAHWIQRRKKGAVSKTCFKLQVN